MALIFIIAEINYLLAIIYKFIENSFIIKKRDILL